MREGKIPPTRDAIDALLASVDIVRQMVVAAQENKEVAEGFGAEVAEQLNNIAGNTSAAPVQLAAVAEEDNEISIYDIDFKGFRKLIHIDAYRLEREDELVNLGWEKMLSEPTNLIFIEWPERVVGLIPAGAVKISLKFIDEQTRELHLHEN